MRKLVFFDSDGTFRHGETGEVPESTVTAMKELQARNIGVILCTGRHPKELEEMGFLNYGFDGLVCINGQLVLDKDLNVISAKAIEGNDKEELLRLFHSRTVPMILFEKDRLFMNFHNEQVAKLKTDPLLPICDIGNYEGADIFMSTLIIPKDKEVSFSNLDVKHWHDLAADVFLPGVGKVYGVRQFMEREGLDRSDIIAFGDSGNDIDMLKIAGLGIAMGNASEDVKSIADYVTDRVEEDGIRNALIRFNIID